MPIIRSPRPFTTIPNFYFDKCIKELSHLEFKILIYIFYLNEDSAQLNPNMSLGSISDNANISRSALVQILDKLCSMNLIKKIKSINEDGGAAPNSYSINFDIMEVVNACVS